MPSEIDADYGLLSIESDRYGQVRLECNVRVPHWCSWELEVPPGITLTEMVGHARRRYEEAHGG